MKNFFIITIAIAALHLTGCKKNNYYDDSGTTNGKFNGTTMDYLKSKPEYFSSIVNIIRVAGLENALQNEQVTFFAPADSSVNYLFRYVNDRLRELGKTPITSIDQVAPRLWTKYMSRYVFNFKKQLKDFPQVDFANLTTFSGQIYPAVNGTYMNIGAVYESAFLGGTDGTPRTEIPYAGYRYLTISYLSSQYNPKDFATWRMARVASVNVETNNGYVHVLRYATHYFGFDESEFAEDIAFNNY